MKCETEMIRRLLRGIITKLHVSCYLFGKNFFGLKVFVLRRLVNFEERLLARVELPYVSTSPNPSLQRRGKSENAQTLVPHIGHSVGNGNLGLFLVPGCPPPWA